MPRFKRGFLPVFYSCDIHNMTVGDKDMKLSAYLVLQKLLPSEKDFTCPPRHTQNAWGDICILLKSLKLSPVLPVYVYLDL